MKRLVTLILVLALCLTPALADTQELFPAKAVYPGFGDVSDGLWYTDAVKTCYEVGLMKGTSQETFEPGGIMTVAEAATIAARIREVITGEAIPNATPVPGQSKNWYDDYVNYLIHHGVDVALPTQRATRDQFFAYLAAVVPASELPAINAVTALPDTDSAAVLMFYNAGILTGTDAYGTFNAAGSLSRAECAAMVARIIRPALRQRFTLQEKPAPAPGPSYQEELDSALAMKINGQDVSMSEFVANMDRFIFETDYSLYSQTGKRLNWDTDYGVGDLNTFFIEQTKQGLIYDTVVDQQAKAMACKAEDLAATLSPNPSHDVLSAYAEGMDLLCAKHILLKTYDPYGGEVNYTDSSAQTFAQQIIDAIDAQPSYQQFENLMGMYNDDQGMKANPEGYLFTKGEMVTEFEEAVRALPVGGYSGEPVKSLYGYHIILRLDPADHSEVKTRYQNAILENLAKSWAASATVTSNDVMLGQLDVKTCYEMYWDLLTKQAGQ